MITQISASAGSGKTYTLTRLFLELLEKAEPPPSASGCALHGSNRGYSLAEILAATFTNKAASEMKNRVILSLKSRALEERRRQGAFPEQAGMAERWVERILRHYSALNIRTIDSLLTSLTRLSALELDLPPDFEPSFSPTAYFTPHYDALMEDLARGNHLFRAMEGQSRLAEGGGQPALFYSAPPERLSADLLLACRSLLFAGNSKGFLTRGRLHDQTFELLRLLLTGQELPAMDVESLLARLSALHAGLVLAAAALLRLLEGEGLSVQARFLTFLGACAKLAPHTSPPDSVYARREDFDECVNKASKGKASAPVLEGFAAFRRAFAAYTENLIPFRHALQLAPLVSLARELFRRMEARSFDDKLLPALRLPFLAAQALSGEYGVSDALCRLGTRLSRLLLDEFQDTSREQWAAVLPLVLESLSTGGGLTYVGDAKQAIYGWRGGDARLFENALNEPALLAVAPERQQLLLPCNWRSHPAIVAHNNAFFSLLSGKETAGAVMAAMLPAHTPESYIAMARDEVARLFSQAEQRVPPEKNWDADAKSPQAGVRLYIAEGENEEAVRDMVFTRLRSLLLDELLPQWRYGDIAVLVRSGADGALVAERLTAWGLPVVTENSFLLAAHPLVNRLIAFLGFLDYPPDDQAFWEFISGPECFGRISGLAAEALLDWLSRTIRLQGAKRQPLFQTFRKDFPEAWERWIAPFHSGAGLMSAYDTLRESIERFALLTLMPGQAPFLLRLLEIAHLAETRGHSSLAAFLHFWRENSAEEQLPLPEGMDAVRVMTIHKAKGLEFPVVVLPFQHKGQRREPELVRIQRDGLDLLTRATRELPEHYYPACITDELERLNLLYVAWTRPVYALHAFVTRPENTSSPLRRGLESLLEAYRARADAQTCQWEDLALLPKEELLDHEPDSPLPLLRNNATPRHKEGEAPPLPDATSTVSVHAQWLPLPLSENGHNETAHASRTVRPAAAEIPEPLRPAWRPMEWLPGLKIYRSGLEDSRFTPARRGILAHLCLEHLLLSETGTATRPFSGTVSASEAVPSSEASPALLNDVRSAVRQGLRLFPFPVDNPEEAAREMEDCLLWFASLPGAALWLAHGRREQGVIDRKGGMHRVDLLVDEAGPPGRGLIALDYKTGRAIPEETREEHRRQVRRYMRLVAEARQLPVRGLLAYLDERRLEEVFL